MAVKKPLMAEIESLYVSAAGVVGDFCRKHDLGRQKFSGTASRADFILELADAIEMVRYIMRRSSERFNREHSCYDVLKRMASEDNPQNMTEYRKTQDLPQYEKYSERTKELLALAKSEGFSVVKAMKTAVKEVAYREHIDKCVAYHDYFLTEQLLADRQLNLRQWEIYVRDTKKKKEKE